MWGHFITFEVVSNTKGKDGSERTEVLSADEGLEMPDCHGTSMRQWGIKECGHILPWKPRNLLRSL
jgi:hypothetical protein